MDGLKIVPDKGTCLVPGCNQPAKTRGLCPTHYMYAHRLVSRGKTTWAVLEQEGKCLPSHSSPNPTKDWFMGGSVEAQIQEDDPQKEEVDQDLIDHHDPDNPYRMELGEGD